MRLGIPCFFGVVNELAVDSFSLFEPPVDSFSLFELNRDLLAVFFTIFMDFVNSAIRVSYARNFFCIFSILPGEMWVLFNALSSRLNLFILAVFFLMIVIGTVSEFEFERCVL